MCSTKRICWNQYFDPFSITIQFSLSACSNEFCIYNTRKESSNLHLSCGKMLCDRWKKGKLLQELLRALLMSHRRLKGSKPNRQTTWPTLSTSIRLYSIVVQCFPSRTYIIRLSRRTNTKNGNETLAKNAFFYYRTQVRSFSTGASRAAWRVKQKMVQEGLQSCKLSLGGRW